MWMQGLRREKTTALAPRRSLRYTTNRPVCDPGRIPRMRTRLALSVAALVAFLNPAPAADPKADVELVKTAQGMLKDLRTHTLENGLRVYLLPVKNSPIVTVMVAYRV